LKKVLIIFYTFLIACSTGNLFVIANLPTTLREASGIALSNNSDLIWMINDSGNAPILYAVDLQGKIKKQLKINAKNHDWEDLTTDNEGNIYIGDFGNNANNRKHLSILKVSKDSIDVSGKIEIDRISFSYPEQHQFPPKKKQMHFDSESFLFYNDSLYLFTKSRYSKEYGKTNLYKIPATPGKHEAAFISSFNTCNDYGCWVTSADISASKKQVVLLTEHSAFAFTDFKKDDFFSGKVNIYPFDHFSQKESVCFKNDSTLYISDERSSGRGGNLYEFKLN
jgi:hypothetical protein